MSTAAIDVDGFEPNFLTFGTVIPGEKTERKSHPFKDGGRFSASGLGAGNPFSAK